jgi:hypothetical protein
MKKGTTESLSALIGIMIAILIITPMIVIGYRYMSSLNSNKKCFDEIVKAAEDLQEGQTKNVLCKFNKRSSMISFDNDDQIVRTKQIFRAPKVKLSTVMTPISISLPLELVGGQTLRNVLVWFYEKPKSAACPDSSLACLCLCPLEVPELKDKSFLDKVNILSTEKRLTLRCEGFTRCAQFPGIVKIKGYNQFGSLKSFNYGNFYVIKKEDVIGFKIKKIGNQLLICDANKGCALETTDIPFMVVGVSDAIDESIRLCKSSNDDNCKCPMLAIGFDSYKLYSHNGYLSVLAVAGDDLIKIKDDIGRMCILEDDKKKYLPQGEKIEDIGNFMMVRAGNEVCIAKSGFEKLPLCNLPQEQKLDKIKFIEECKNEAGDNCICKSEIDPENYLKSNDVNYKFKEFVLQYIDKGRQLLLVTEKDSTLELYENLGDKACYYDGKEKHFLTRKGNLIYDKAAKTNHYDFENMDRYKFTSTKLAKVGGDVCFTATDNLNLPQCGASTVPLR